MFSITATNHRGSRPRPVEWRSLERLVRDVMASQCGSDSVGWTTSGTAGLDRGVPFTRNVMAAACIANRMLQAGNLKVGCAQLLFPGDPHLTRRNSWN